MFRENRTIQKSELTKQNLRDFEEKLSSQAAVSHKRERLVFSSKGELIQHNQSVKQGDEHKEEVEGEGDDVENPNEAELNQGEFLENPGANAENAEKNDGVSILSRSEVQSMSKLSRKSYVDSLRNELRRERDKREELERQVRELVEHKRA